MKNVVFRNVTILEWLGCQPSQVVVNNTYTSINFENLMCNSRKIISFGDKIILKDTSSDPLGTHLDIVQITHFIDFRPFFGEGSPGLSGLPGKGLLFQL